MEDIIAKMAKAGTVHNLYPLLSTDPNKANTAMIALHTASKVSFSKLLEVDTSTPAAEDVALKLDWKAIAKKNVWVVLRLGIPFSPLMTDSGEEAPPLLPGERDPRVGVVSEVEKKLVRHAAVNILCARTNDCHSNFKLWVLTTPTVFTKLPRLALHLSSLVEPGRWCAASCDDDPASLLEGDIEFWDNYAHVEDAANASGAIADLQEEVFNSNPGITEVIYDPALGDGTNYIKIMRDALKFNLCVKTLNMTKSLAGDTLGFCLTSVLHSSRKLQRLVLEECSLTDVGVGQLAKALSTNPFITEVNLRRNPGIGDMGLLAMAQAISSPPSRLQVFDISKNNSLYTEEKQWSSDALNSLWDALGSNSYIREVKLSECGIQAADCIEACKRWISRSKNLEYLNISDNTLGDVAVGFLLDCSRHLKWLNINHTGLGASGFRAVGIALGRKETTELTWLAANSNNALRLNNVTEEDLLEAGVVDPATTKKTQQFSEGAASNSGKETTEQRQEESAVDALQLINGNDSPQVCYLSREMKNALTIPHNREDEGAAVDFMLNSLAGNRTLRSVELSKVNFGDRGVEKLVDLLLNGQCVVDSIDISCNCNIEEISSHKVKEILCGGYYDKTPADEGEVQQQQQIEEAQPSIEALSQVNEEGVKTGGLLVPTNSGGLTTTTQATPTSSSSGPTVTNPIHLSLAGNATSVGERAILAMYDNKHLKTIDLSDMAIVDGMLLPFSEGVANNPHLRLEEVCLRRNFILRSGIITLSEFVSASRTLVKLDISDTWASFTDEAGRASSLSKTKEEGLYYMRPLLKVLEQQPSPSLVELDMSDNDVGNALGKAFASAVAGNTNLKTLRLKGNPGLNPLLMKGCPQAIL